MSGRGDRPRNTSEANVFAARAASFWTWCSTVHDDLLVELGQRGGLPGPIELELGDRIGVLLGGAFVQCDLDSSSGQFRVAIETLGDVDREILKRGLLAAKPVEVPWLVPLMTLPNPRATVVLPNEIAVTAASVLCAIQVDRKVRKVDVELSHEAFLDVAPETAMDAASALVYQSIGANLMRAHVRSVRVVDKRTDVFFGGGRRLRPMSNLSEMIENVARRKNWVEPAVDEIALLSYRREPAAKWTRWRDDITMGDTMHSELCNEYYSGMHAHASFLAEHGGEYAFLAFKHRGREGKEIVADQELLINRLDAVLEAGRVGLLIGGAFGSRAVYTDLALYDPAAARRSFTSLSNDLGFEVVCKSFPG